MNVGKVRRRAYWAVSLRLLCANLFGAVAVFVYLSVISPSPSTVSHATRESIIRLNVLVFVPFMALSLSLGVPWLTRRFDRALGWAGEGRDPTQREIDRMLRLPRSLLVYPMTVWLVAVGVFTPLALLRGGTWVLSVRVGSATLLAGLTTVLVVYLLVERALRPVASLALSYGVPERPRALGIMPRVLVSWLLAAALPLLSVGLTQVLRTPDERQHLQLAIWFVVSIGLFTGALAMAVAAKSVAEPIRDLRRVAHAVQGGNLDVAVPIKDASEVGLLQSGFNDMVAGLRERRRLEDLFGRHVGEDVARQALQRGMHLDGEQRDVSILFTDVVGSTRLAQERGAADLLDALNAFFAEVVAATTAEGGWVNKFEGDGAMCVFGAPAELPGHRAAALRAARALHARLGPVREAYGLDAGIGVSAGTVTAGNVGAEERYEYTVIGDPVNEAARLTEAAKTRPVRVLASAAAVDGAGDEAACWEPAGEEHLRGRAGPTRVYVPRA